MGDGPIWTRRAIMEFNAECDIAVHIEYYYSHQLSTNAVKSILERRSRRAGLAHRMVALMLVVLAATNRPMP